MKIPEKTYKKILSSVPIICVDLLILKQTKIKSRKKFLLMKRNNKPLMGQWWLPGGRVYKNESLLDAVKRKCKEECNLLVDKYKKIGIIEYIGVEAPFKNMKDGVHIVSIVYEVTPKNGDILLDSQHNDYNWFYKNEFPKKLIKTLKNIG